MEFLVNSGTESQYMHAFIICGLIFKPQNHTKASLEKRGSVFSLINFDSLL